MRGSGNKWQRLESLSGEGSKMDAQEQTSKLIGELMAKSWVDESFKKRLLENATETLKAEGVLIPEGIKVNVVENTGNVLNFVLPTNPAAELSDTDLEMVAGGKSNKDKIQWMDKTGKIHYLF